MATLTFNNLTRQETNQSVIDNLQRKGWALVIDPPAPVIPEHDWNTQKLEIDPETQEYSVVDLSTEELQQRADMNAIIEAQTAAYNLRQSIQDKITAGYTVEPEGFILGLSDNDRNVFTQMLTLTQEALSLDLISNDTEQSIIDKSGQKHLINTLRFRQIMIGYGMYYKGLWDQLSN